MKNPGRLVGLMMLGIGLVLGSGCGDSGSSSNSTAQPQSPTVKPSQLAWAEVLEQSPDPKVVTDADLLKRIVDTKLPWRVRDKKSGIEMLLVPPGKFVMGMSPGDQEAGQYAHLEKPAHEVTITKAFYFGKTEVTQEQWVRVMQSNPSEFQGLGRRDAEIQSDIDAGLTMQEAQAKAGLDNTVPTAGNPVENVSWNDCQKFCAATGLRLPTEAEWEYACRAGVRKPRYGAIAQIAWSSEWRGNGERNDPDTTSPVGKKLPNALGFYDTIGNVWEWCNDFYQEDYYNTCKDGVVDPKGPSSSPARVLRGGAWNKNSVVCRASLRSNSTPDYASSKLGFRSARTP